MTDNGLQALQVEQICPRCSRPATYDLWVVADTGLHPPLRELIAAGGLNRLTCPACRHEFRAPTPVLFHDPDSARALAFVPEALSEESEAIVSGLLLRYLRATGEQVPDDALLTPVVYTAADEFAAALAGVATDRERQPQLAAAADWCRQQGADQVARALDLLDGVGDLPQFLALVNEQPGLLEPAVIQQMARLGAEADDDEVGTLLRDVATALRAHTPELDAELVADEPDFDPHEIRDLLAAGELEAAVDFLERPVPTTTEDFRRSMLTTLEPELREGFIEHARVFGEVLEDMLDETVPGVDPGVENASLDALEPLLVAPTLDAVLDLLRATPELISRDTIRQLREAEALALHEGDDARANHLGMLINSVYIAADDETLESELDDELDG